MARFVDRTGQATEEIRAKLAPVALGMAEVAEREVRQTMERSVPSGERYPDPEGGTYVASAPGDPPAIRTREYIESYGTTGPIKRGSKSVAAVRSDRMVGRNADKPLWAILEYGTFRQAPRPHVRPGSEAAARVIRQLAGGRAELRRAA